MITPEQKQAWREEYLGEMRKISLTPETLGEDSLLEDLDDSILEDHFFHFYFSFFIPYAKAIGFVLMNHPLVVASIDKDWIRSTDKITLGELYEYLVELTRYGQVRFLSEVKCEEPSKQELFDSLQNRDKDSFLETISKDHLDLSEECLKVGYSQMLLSFVLQFVSSMLDIAKDEDEQDDEEQIEEVVHQGKEFMTERYGENYPKLTKELEIEDIASYSNLDFSHCDSEFESAYSSVVAQMNLLQSFVDSFFDKDEEAVLNDSLNCCSFADIINDIQSIMNLIEDSRMSPEDAITQPHKTLEDMPGETNS